MKLTDILISDACVIDMRARTKKEALRELAEALSGSHPQLDARELLSQLLERENLGTTAMGDGIAIPHARLESLDRLLVGCGLCPGGIDFGSLDGKPTRLFFLLVAPGREGSAHLLTLARLSRLLSRPEFRGRLLEVSSVEELFAAFEEQEASEA